eukprot:446503-Amphidinium_carterae.1
MHDQLAITGTPFSGVYRTPIKGAIAVSTRLIIRDGVKTVIIGLLSRDDCKRASTSQAPDG